MVSRRIRRMNAARHSHEGRAVAPPGWKKLTKSELRAAQIEILNAFADFCVTNDLSYFLYAGTLLGCVRHGGFIPWDDDIDIVMPRQDFNQLNVIASRHAAINGFSLHSSTVSPGFPWPFAKVVDNRETLSIEDDGVNYSIGINIDIFPLDGWPASLVRRWIHHQSLRILRALIYSHHLPFRFNRPNLRESALVLAKPVARLVSVDWLVRKVSSFASRYSAEDSGLVGVTVWGYPERVTAQAYFDILELPFEERLYRVPSGYDAILSAKYGNYMRLPPPQLQVSPHAIEAFRLI